MMSPTRQPDPPAPPPDLQARVLRALSWRLALQLVSQLITWGITIIVIRLLVPADYGVLAMAQVLTSILHLLATGGMADALIQARTVDRAMVRKSFGLLLAINAVLAAVQLAAAPLLAAYYAEPLVAQVMQVQAIGFLLVPFIALPSALREREIDFTATAWIDLAAAVGSAVLTLMLALLGKGIWALVAGQIALLVIRACGWAVATGWLIWPSLDFSGLGRFVRMGGTLTINGLLWAGVAGIDIAIAGRVMSAADVGLYSTALMLAALPTSRLLPLVNQVGFSAYARIQDNPREAGRQFLASSGLVCAVLFPVYLGLAAIAPLFVPVVMGDQWAAAALPLFLLCWIMPLNALYNQFWPMLHGLGKASVQTGNMLFMLAAFGVCFFIGARYGVPGLCAAWAVAMPVSLYWAGRRTLPLVHLTIKDMLGQAARPALAAGLMFGAVSLVSGWLDAATEFANGLQLAALILTGALSYPLILRVVAPDLFARLLGLLKRIA